MSESTWYYTENKQKVGPVPLDELKDKCRLGELGDEDLVWTEGWESWKKVCDVAELASLEPPPLPPEEPPPLPAEVLPENWVLLTNDYQLKKLLEGTGIWSWLPASIFDKNRVIKEIREKLRAKKKYGLVVEPAKEGAYQLRGVFGGRRMFDFRSVPSHVDTPEPVQSTKESLQMKDTNINQPLAQLGGIGGWLYLVGLGVILSPFGVGSELVSFIQLISGETWEALTSPGSDIYHPILVPFLISSMAIGFVRFIVYIYLIYMFFTKRKGFPVWFTGVLLISFCSHVWTAWASQLMLPDEPMDPELIGTISRSLLQCLIWIPYVFVSKRVKATFTQ